MDTGYIIFFQDSDGNYVYSTKYDGDPETVYGSITSSLEDRVSLYDMLEPNELVVLENVPNFIDHTEKIDKVRYTFFKDDDGDLIYISPSKQYVFLYGSDDTEDFSLVSGSVGDRIINVNIQDWGYFDAELIRQDGNDFLYRFLNNEEMGLLRITYYNEQIQSVYDFYVVKTLYPLNKDPEYYRLYDTSWQNVMTERLEFSNGGPSMPVFTFDVANAYEISSSGQTTYYRSDGTSWYPSEFSGETGSDFILRVINYGETNYGYLTTGSSSTVLRGHGKSTYDGSTFVSFESDDEFQITMLSSLHLIYDPTRFGSYWVIGKYDEIG